MDTSLLLGSETGALSSPFEAHRRASTSSARAPSQHRERLERHNAEDAAPEERGERGKQHRGTAAVAREDPEGLHFLSLLRRRARTADGRGAHLETERHAAEEHYDHQDVDTLHPACGRLGEHLWIHRDLPAAT